MNTEKKEVLQILNRLLSELNITEKELLFDKFFCIREFKATPNTKDRYVGLYLSVKNKEKYPKNYIISSMPMYLGDYKEYAYKRDNRDMMRNIFFTLLLNNVTSENIHKACYACIDLLYTGLITGLNFTASDWYIRKEIKVSQKVKDYLHNNSDYFGNQKHFTDMDDSWMVLKNIKTVEDIRKHVVEEIKKYIETRCFFIFIPTKVPEEDVVRKKISDFKYNLKSTLSEIDSPELKELFITEILESLTNKVDLL